MIPEKEKLYLRDLAKELKEISQTDANNLKRKKWYDINNLKQNSTPVFMNHYFPPVSIHELFPKDSFVCDNPKARQHELFLKTRLFYAKDLEDDNVIEPVIYSDVSWGMQEYEGLKRLIHRSHNDKNNSGAYEMIPVITAYENINKLTLPKITYNEKDTLFNYEETYDIFSPILTVIKKPVCFASKIADEYSWLRGMENTYMDLYDDPDWMKDALERIKNNILSRFTTLEELGIWGTLDNSFPLGSAGLRYADGIPDFRSVDDPLHYKMKLNESWGFTCADVFTCVSNDMHNEFSFHYDHQVMDLFKYINIGCCEVLDKKIDLVRTFPNARKVSVSEWCDYECAASQIKNQFVYSYRAAGTPFVPEHLFYQLN